MPPQTRLGTLFTGKIDETFRRAVTQIRTLMDESSKRLIEGTKKAIGLQNQLQVAIRKAGGEAQTSAKQITPMAMAVERLGRAFKTTTAFAISGGTTFGFITAIRGGIAAIANYSQTLKNLQAITSSTDSDTTAMGQTIQDVAVRTKFSMSEVGEGMTLLGQAGLSARKSIQTIEAAANLATGTLSKMEETTDLLTTTMMVFDIEAEKSSEIADIFASAVNKSKLDIQKLRTAFNYIGPVAAKAGLSLADTATATSILGNAGLRASTIGTGFRQVLSRLVAPSASLRESFSKLGISLSDLNPKTNNFEDIIERLTLVVPNAQRAFELFGQRGASAVLALIQGGKKGFVEMRAEMEKFGSASEMAALQMGGLEVSFANLKSKVKALAVQLGKGGLIDSFTFLINVLKGVVDGFAWIEESRIGNFVLQLTLYVAGLTAGLVALSGAIYGVGTALRVLWITASKVPLLRAGFIGAILLTVYEGIKWIISYSDKWDERLKKNIDKQIEQSVQIEKTISTMKRYEDALLSTTRSSEEKDEIVKKLIRDFPNLVTEVDLATASYENYANAVKKAREEQVTNLAVNKIGTYEEQIKLVNKYTEDLYDANREMERLKSWNKRIEPFIENGPQIHKMDYERNIRDIRELGSKISKIQSDLDKNSLDMKGTTDTLIDNAKEINGITFENFEESVSKLRDYFKSSTGSDKTADYLIYKMRESFKTIQEEQKKIQDVSDLTSKKVQSIFMVNFDELSPLKQVRMLQAYNRMIEKRNELEDTQRKDRSEKGFDVEGKMAIPDDLRRKRAEQDAAELATLELDSYLKIVELLDAGVEKQKETNIRMVNIISDRIQETNSLREEEKISTEKDYKKRIESAKGVESEITKINEEYKTIRLVQEAIYQGKNRTLLDASNDYQKKVLEKTQEEEEKLTKEFNNQMDKYHTDDVKAAQDKRDAALRDAGDTFKKREELYKNDKEKIVEITEQQGTLEEAINREYQQEILKLSEKNAKDFVDVLKDKRDRNIAEIEQEMEEGKVITQEGYNEIKVIENKFFESSMAVWEQIGNEKLKLYGVESREYKHHLSEIEEAKATHEKEMFEIGKSYAGKTQAERDAAYAKFNKSVNKDLQSKGKITSEKMKGVEIDIKGKTIIQPEELIKSYEQQKAYLKGFEIYAQIILQQRVDKAEKEYGRDNENYENAVNEQFGTLADITKQKEVLEDKYYTHLREIYGKLVDDDSRTYRQMLAMGGAYWKEEKSQYSSFYDWKKAKEDEGRAHLKMALELGAIDNEEYLKRMAIQYGSTWDAIKYGFREAAIEGNTFKEILANFSGSLGDQMGGEIFNFFDRMAEGTMTVKQSFDEMGRSILKWLAQIVAQETISYGIRSALHAIFRTKQTAQDAGAFAAQSALFAAFTAQQIGTTATGVTAQTTIVGAGMDTIAVNAAAATPPVAAYAAAQGAATGGATITMATAALIAFAAAAAGFIGGLVMKKEGGLITTGSGTKDDVPALLMKDEFVVRRRAVEKYGVNFLEALNNGNLSLSNLVGNLPVYAMGGMVNNVSGGTSSVSPVNITYDMRGSQFLDKGTLNSAMKSIASQAVSKEGPNAWIRAYQGNHPVRQVVRGGK